MFFFVLICQTQSEFFALKDLNLIQGNLQKYSFIDIYEKLNQLNPKKQTFISPFSIGVTMMMLFKGTSGMINKELLDFLRFREGYFIKDQVIKEKMNFKNIDFLS